MAPATGAVAGRAETEDERNRRLGYRPLTLNERQQRLMESRGIMRIQPRPTGVAPIPLNVRGREGIPVDVMFALEAVRQQAEQGNRFAKWLYERECAELGIDVRPKSLILP